MPGKKRYRVQFRRSARKEFLQLPARIQDKIVEALSFLAENPFTGLLQIKKLRGREKLYRIRIGDYRRFCRRASALRQQRSECAQLRIGGAACALLPRGDAADFAIRGGGEPRQHRARPSAYRLRTDRVQDSLTTAPNLRTRENVRAARRVARNMPRS